jgi:peroxiredoxin
MLKKASTLTFTCALVAALVAVAHASSNDQIASRILELFPKADTDGDGVLSDVEETALSRAALKKYPPADVDGDGLLSDSEKESLLRKAVKAKSQGTLNDLLNSGTPGPEQASLKFAGSSVRQGPRPISPGQHGIGRHMPNLSFTDIAGKQHSLSEFAGRKAVVFAMTGTGCPLCLKYSPSLAAIEKQYRNQGVSFIFINPNESEQSDRLQEEVRKHRFEGPYVSDGRKHLSAALGAVTTTEVFVLDQARTLAYRGAVDDQYGFAYALDSPRVRYLADALDAVLADQTPPVQATTSPGCELFYDKADEPETEPSITYHNRISRIIQANCIQCHRDGGIAPIALESYEEVKDYAGMIRNVVGRGVMPPWFAAPHDSSDNDESPSLHWANDRTLSTSEKNDLYAWLNAGGPKGDPDDAPLPRAFPDGWLIGKPDAVFEFPRPVPIKATGTMPYQHVTVETHLTQDRWVQAIEVRPGQPDVVHHVIVALGSDDGEVDESAGYWGAYVPGNSTLVYPDGYARLLPKGATLRFQMHYTPNGTATRDSTRIGLVFAKERPKHEVKVFGISNKTIRIPPGVRKDGTENPAAENHRESASLRLPYDVQLLSFLPHMHLRGKAARYEALTSHGTEMLLDIPRYDFNWQLLYQLAEPQTLHKGDTIQFTCWFDNSRNNPANPDPTKTVRWGQQTEDEMHLGYVEYIVPGTKPGGQIAGMGRPRVVSAPRSGGDTNEVRIDGQQIKISELLNAIRKLDKNKDGKLIQVEVPAKHRKLFDLFDANDDDILTTDEARESIYKRIAQ